MCWNKGCCVLSPCRIPTLRSCFQVSACRSQPAAPFSLPELGIKLLEHNFHIPGRGCCLQSHHLLPIWFQAALHSLPRLCPSSPVHSQNLPLSITQTAPWDLLATRQVRSCVLAPKFFCTSDDNSYIISDSIHPSFHFSCVSWIRGRTWVASSREYSPSFRVWKYGQH